jgi:hypothetical protein
MQDDKSIRLNTTYCHQFSFFVDALVSSGNTTGQRVSIVCESVGVLFDRRSHAAGCALGDAVVGRGPQPTAAVEHERVPVSARTCC